MIYNLIAKPYLLISMAFDENAEGLSFVQ